jgi:hypothetical protein
MSLSLRDSAYVQTTIIKGNTFDDLSRHDRLRGEGSSKKTQLLKIKIKEIGRSHL